MTNVRGLNHAPRPSDPGKLADGQQDATATDDHDPHGGHAPSGLAAKRHARPCLAVGNADARGRAVDAVPLRRAGIHRFEGLVRETEAKTVQPHTAREELLSARPRLSRRKSKTRRRSWKPSQARKSPHAPGCGPRPYGRRQFDPPTGQLRSGSFLPKHTRAAGACTPSSAGQRARVPSSPI